MTWHYNKMIQVFQLILYLALCGMPVTSYVIFMLPRPYYQSPHAVSLTVKIGRYTMFSTAAGHQMLH